MNNRELLISVSIVEDWLSIIHDNELALGDRLQRLSIRLSKEIDGTADNILKHKVREQLPVLRMLELIRHGQRSSTVNGMRDVLKRLAILLGEDDDEVQFVPGGVQALADATQKPVHYGDIVVDPGTSLQSPQAIELIILERKFAHDLLGALFNGSTFNPEGFEEIKQKFASIMRSHQ